MKLTNMPKKQEIKLNKYEVALDIAMIERVEVEAKNKKEAFRKAMNDSVFRGEGASFGVFEIIKLN